LNSTIRPVARLANDIARQFEYLPLDSAAQRVVAHLTSFWDPRMRAELMEVPDESLEPVAAAARNLLRTASRP
jgi:formate dehydrogenase subunit delta